MANAKLTTPDSENKMATAGATPSGGMSCSVLIREADRTISAARALEGRQDEAATRAYAVADERREALKRLILAAAPESFSDALCCVLALQSDVDNFHESFDLGDLPADVREALAARERRWGLALRNVAGALTQEGAETPAAFGEFYGSR